MSSARAPSAKTLAKLGLTADADGQVSVKMLTGASGEGFSAQLNEIYRCEPKLGVILVRRRYAQPA